jgi:N-acyl-D-amino-acid deacylase
MELAFARFVVGPTLVLATLAGTGAAASGPRSTLIVGARLVDGTGAASRRAAVRIQGDRIMAVGAVAPRATDEIVDAAGLTLAPGFIDTHSHHDEGLFEQLDAPSAVTQGITTIVVGQDGSSALPLKDFFARLERTPPALNVASFLGHNDLRAAVMGSDTKRPASPAEIDRMRALIRSGMEDGALGLSTGLEYDSGIYSNTAELIALAREAARYGGRYISHIRSEDRELWHALDEVVEIGRATGMPVQVSHMKLAMTDWWGQAPRFIDVLERARASGVDLTGDVYPYEYWHATLAVLFPHRDFSDREAAEFALHSVAPPDGLRLTEFSPEPALVGKTVAEIAAARGTDPATTLMALVAQAQAPGAEEAVMGTSMRADDTAALIAWPYANICSDGTLNGGHPRGAGAFTKVLRLYVREQKLLTLEEAIRKMTSAAAAHMGLADRGTIRPGALADLVLFDPATVSDRSTVEEPRAPSVGIAKVWVNGVVVLADGHTTGAHPGRVLRRVSSRPFVPEPIR